MSSAREAGRRRAVLALGALALAGCVAQLDAGTEWTPIAEIAGELAPEVGPDPAPRPAPAVLRVGSWNVHRGADVAQLAANLAASRELVDADVLLVQEIEAYAAEGSTRARRLAEALDMTWIYAPARTEPGGTHGIALLSRFPLERAEVRVLPRFSSAFNERTRIALRADVVLDDLRLEVVNVHLDVRIGAVDRVRQLDPAIAELAAEAIVGGDFNTNPWAWVEGTLPLTATEAIVGQDQARVIDHYMAAQGFVTALSADTSTFTLPAFPMRIDDIYARGNAITDAGVEHVAGSDHWPIWADLAIQNRPDATAPPGPTPIRSVPFDSPRPSRR
jgi:endonuclease/exonuclease/phosphatase family metal-dependent hydrolase